MSRLANVRYLGLAASVLLAVVAWLGGALPHGDLHSTPVSVARGPYGAVILGGWLVGTVILAYAWWGARDRIPSARWAVVTAGLWTLPFLAVPPFGSRDVYSYACQGYLYTHGLSPYQHGVSALLCPWIDGVALIWRDTAAPYGPLYVLISGGAVRLGAGSLVAIVLIFRLVAVAGLVAVALGLPALARRCGVPAGRALWIALAGPLIGAHLIGGPHNDALMIGLVVAGLALAVVAARHPAAQAGAGALLGLAVAVKVTAIVVVPFAVLLVVARPYRLWPALRAGGLLAGGTLAAMAGVTAASGLGFGWIGGMLNTHDLVQFTSPPTAVGMTVTYAGQLLDHDFDAVPIVRVLATVLFVAVLAVLCWRAARSAEPVAGALRGAALALAATVALAPYFHPWYVTWPLAVLAGTTLRTGLVMAATTAGALLVLPDGVGLARFAKFPGAPLLTIAMVVYLVRYLRRRAQSGPASPAERGILTPSPNGP